MTGTAYSAQIEKNARFLSGHDRTPRAGVVWKAGAKNFLE